MHEKPLKLDMSFDEALLRISKTPKASVNVAGDQESNLEKIKIKSAVECMSSKQIGLMNG